MGSYSPRWHTCTTVSGFQTRNIKRSEGGCLLNRKISSSFDNCFSDGFPQCYIFQEQQKYYVQDFYNAVYHILQPLSLSFHRESAAHIYGKLYWFYDLMALYSCDTTEEEDVSLSQNSFCSFLRCMTEIDDTAVWQKGAIRETCEIECACITFETAMNHVIFNRLNECTFSYISSSQNPRFETRWATRN